MVLSNTFSRIFYSLCALAITLALSVAASGKAFAADDGANSDISFIAAPMILQSQSDLPSWHRLSGLDALETMKSITSNSAGFKKGDCETVILATADGYWDALSASGLAGKYHCPVLLTNPSQLSNQTRSEISRLGVKNVVISGGPAAVSDAIDQTLRDEMGCNVTRMYGDAASDTALKTLEKGETVGNGWGDTIIIATVGGYWDALSIAPYAYAKNSPIVLADSPNNFTGVYELGDNALRALKGKTFKRVVICGGDQAVSVGVEAQVPFLFGDDVEVVRLWGQTADFTSSRVAQFCIDEGMSAKQVGVATMGGYWDALSGASFCGKGGFPMVLVSDSSTGAIDDFLKPHARDMQTGYVFGGLQAVSSAMYDKLVSVTKH